MVLLDVFGHNNIRAAVAVSDTHAISIGRNARMLVVAESGPIMATSNLIPPKSCHD